MATDQVRKIQVPLYLRMLTDFAYFSITGKTQGKRIDSKSATSYERATMNTTYNLIAERFFMKFGILSLDNSSYDGGKCRLQKVDMGRLSGVELGRPNPL